MVTRTFVKHTTQRGSKLLKSGVFLRLDGEQEFEKDFNRDVLHVCIKSDHVLFHQIEPDREEDFDKHFAMLKKAEIPFSVSSDETIVRVDLPIDEILFQLTTNYGQYSNLAEIFLAAKDPENDWLPIGQRQYEEHFAKLLVESDDFEPLPEDNPFSLSLEKQKALVVENSQLFETLQAFCQKHANLLRTLSSIDEEKKSIGQYVNESANDNLLYLMRRTRSAEAELVLMSERRINILRRLRRPSDEAQEEHKILVESFTKKWLTF